MRTVKTLLFLGLGLSLAAPSRTAVPAGSSAGGVRWTVPAAWQAAPERPMRVATYTIPGASGAGGAEPGECGVFFFGRGQGGSVEDNLERWRSQFEPRPDAKPTSRAVNGLTVHELILSGTYLAPGGPMMQSQGKKPGWRLLGAIVESPDGLVFFKCTGPNATMTKAKGDFDALVKSVTKASRT